MYRPAELWSVLASSVVGCGICHVKRRTFRLGSDAEREVIEQDGIKYENMSSATMLPPFRFPLKSCAWFLARAIHIPATISPPPHTSQTPSPSTHLPNRGLFLLLLP